MSRPSAWSVAARLARARLLTPPALWDAAAAIAAGGMNLAALLAFAARRFGDAPAIVEAAETATFRQLWRESEAMAAELSAEPGVRRGEAVAVIGRNGAALVRGLFAASRLGARVVPLNPDMAPPQLAALVAAHAPALVIADAPDTAAVLAAASAPVRLVDEILGAAARTGRRPLGRIDGGSLVVLTGGTTGPPKAAARRPAPLAFAALFVDLVVTLQLDRRRAVFVAAPLLHGYGLAALLVAVALGRPAHLARRFEASAAADLIRRTGFDTIALVPSMLDRLLAHGADLRGLGCVISGGAALPPALAAETLARLGPVLFNLYGTSEAGVALCATPQDLAAEPGTVGRPLAGVDVVVRDGDGDGAALPSGEAGHLLVRSPASARSGGWVETGDLAVRDDAGRFFIRGRIDDMIVSGGENVHPWELESVMAAHPAVRQAVAVGVDDARFGQRLVAFVTPRAGVALFAEELAAWLSGRVARYQRPRRIVIRDRLPLTAIGKIDRRALTAEAASL